MSDELPASGSPCPSCGVTVATGYPKCPKCQAPMPGVGQHYQSGSHNLAGGTAVPQSEGNGTLIAGALIGVAVIAGVVFFIARGGDDKKDADDTRRPQPTRAAKPAIQPTAGPANPDDDTGPTTPTNPEPAATGIDSAAGKAAASLRLELEKKRLWTEVEVDNSDNTLTLRSSYCEDKGLRDVLTSMKASLTAAKLTGASCYAKHGKLIFEETF